MWKGISPPVIELVDAETEGVVDKRHRGRPVRLGHDGVLVALLLAVWLGAGHHPVVLGRVLARRGARGRRDQKARALVEDRVADVDVVQEHVGCRVEADVDDPVNDAKSRATDCDLHTAVQLHRLREHR